VVPDEAARPRTVAILAPTGRDGPLAEEALRRWGIDAVAHPDGDALLAAVRAGVGAVLLAEEALVPQTRAPLIAELDRQPSWSDVPLIVLTADDDLSRAIASGMQGIAERGSITLLERPIRIAILVTTVRTALRARMRQYDVRDHVRALQLARAEAEAANRAKLEFLAMMSHELRTPLNAIAGYVQLLEMGVRGPITPEQREDLDRIQRSQRHLLGLINGVLNFARIERGTVDYDLAAVPMNELLRSAETLVLPQARERGLIVAHTPCDENIAACADREKLQQVVLNLLTNAIKFTPSGGRVDIRCWRQGHLVIVEVSDTGRGIATDKLESIFDPFVQIDSQLTRTEDGVGLGLAISRDLARGMGGDLAVRSHPGDGSTFTVTLPAAGPELVSAIA
jgi:signal transduction histidine kinase